MSGEIEKNKNYIPNNILIAGLNQNNTSQRHTVAGLGSRILLISFFALVENHGGQVKSALIICASKKIRDLMRQ